MGTGECQYGKVKPFISGSMKRTLLLFAAIVLCNVAFSQKIGYFVYVQKCSKVVELKTESLEEAQKFIHSFYPEFCENLEYQFQFTPYYRVNCFKKEIYVEKMQITKRGKYKRLKTFNL